MPKLLLTDITVRSLTPPPQGQITYWDNKLSGFGCRISQGGQKTFIVMHGPREARKRKVIGKYPLQNLKTARDDARKTLAELALGIVDEDTMPINSITFTEAREQFLESSRLRNKPRTTNDYKRLIGRHFKFKGKKLAEITRNDLQRSLSKLGKTPSEHQHAYVAIRIFFNWAFKEELVDINPAIRLHKPPRTFSRERVLSDNELAKVFTQALKHPYPYGAIVALCILTGQRRGEVAMLEWNWIDTKEQTITLPAEKVKNGRSHTFPYGTLVAQIIKDIPEIDQYLFSGHTKDNAIYNGWGKDKIDFENELENVAPYTLHDLRRTFSTLHAKLGTPIHVTEKLLNHISGTVSGVAAIYNRYSYLTEMKEAVEQYDAYINKLITE